MITEKGEKFLTGLLLFIQEAHCDKGTENSWRFQCSGPSYFAHGSTDSFGVITIIGEQVEFYVINL